ncbi:unnamed protein product [Alopecurus aequalis]
MALTRCLHVLLLVAIAATTGASEDRAGVTMCYPPPTLAADGDSEFHGNLLRLLEDLPSAVAPTGFACLESAGRTASDRALVHGLCSNDTAPEPCRRCLADAGKIAEQCGDASRRAIFWDERCSVFYADGANSSASADDEFGAVYFSGDAVPSPDTVSAQRVVALAHSLAQLAPKNYDSVATADATIPASKCDDTNRNRTVEVRAKCKRESSAPDCALCLREASLAIARSWEAGGGAQGRVALVHDSDCYLLFKISTPPTLGEMIKTVGVGVLKGVVQGALIGVFIGGLVVALMDVYDRMRMKTRNNRNAAAAAPGCGRLETISGIKTMK